MSDRRNIILQALGPEPGVKIDLTHQRVRRDNVLVLCSNGLSGLVRAEQIAQAVNEEASPELAAERLVDLANASGGPDNITVVIARFDGTGLESPSAVDDVGHRVFDSPDLVTPTSTPPVLRIESIPELIGPLPPEFFAEPPIPPVERQRRRDVLRTRARRGRHRADAVLSLAGPDKAVTGLHAAYRPERPAARSFPGPSGSGTRS